MISHATVASAGLLLALAAIPATTPAQDVYGTVRGSVVDASGAPAAGARVTLPGTAFAVIADAEGRYVLRAVPAGEYTLRAQLGGAAPGDRTGLRVPPGTTVHMDLKLGTSEPAPATRTATPDPFASGAVIPDEMLRSLPIDDPRHALTLAPGVVARGTDRGIASLPELFLRGSGADQTAVYVDGAPARFETLGGQGLAVGTNALAQVTVSTGVAGAAFADARGASINYSTRTGGSALRGGLRIETDEPFGNGSTVGYNRIEGDAGGPFPGVRNLTWFIALGLQGQRSLYRGWGAADQPAYVVGAQDTIVDVPSGPGTVPVAVPRFDHSHELRRPMDWSTLGHAHAKLVYSYGQGSSVSVTGLTSGLQQRSFPGTTIVDPALFTGARAWSRLGVVNWNHALREALRVSVNLSLGTDRQVSGLVDPAVELDTRHPVLGIESTRLTFVGLDSIPFPLPDRIVRNIRSNSGLRAPLLGRSDLQNVQGYRLNPFGMAQDWPTQGADGRLTFTTERRWNVRTTVDWIPAGSVHDVAFGLDGERTDLTHYDSDLIRQLDQNVFVAHPRRIGLFATDRIGLQAGERTIVFDIGLRYDHYSPGTEFPLVPGRIPTNPAWSPGAGTDDTAYANSVARVFRSGRGRGALSPRLRGAVAISASTSVRASYGRQVEAPTYSAMLRSANADFAFASIASTIFGGDVDYRTTSLIELGARHAFGSEWGLDVALYRKSHVSPYATGVQRFDDPANPGRPLDVHVLVPVDDHATGVDARLDWGQSESFSASVSYSLLRTHTDTVPNYPNHPTSSTQAVFVAAAWRAPGDLATTLTLRLTSGLPYPKVAPNLGSGTTVPIPGGPLIDPIGHLPWISSLDFRLARRVGSGQVNAAVFADARNLLGTRNQVGAYAETGGDRNDPFRQSRLGTEYSNLWGEASVNGALLAGNTVDLRPSCSTWTNPVNCVALQRVEARFGNGDKVYTPAEQDRALNTFFDSFLGAWRFHGPGRTLRLGIELGF